MVEGKCSRLHKLEPVSGAWLADVLTRLRVRYPEVQVVFADSRAFAEDWTYRFRAAALGDATEAGSRPLMTAPPALDLAWGHVATDRHLPIGCRDRISAPTGRPQDIVPWKPHDIVPDHQVS